jgi:hypothetical protein
MGAIAGVLLCARAWADAGLAGFVDPTRPATAPRADAEATPSGPVLQSTLIAPGIKRAVIGGKTYTVGERVGGATIVDIRSYEVVLEQGGRETRLRLVPVLAKETVAPPGAGTKE